MKRRVLSRVLASMVACAVFALIGAGLIGAGLIGAAPPSSKIFPPNSIPYGQSYAQWSASWWQWGLELPVAGHPFTDSGDFDVTDGQSGQVWYLAAAFGTIERTCTIPAGKALFVGMANAETSSLEGVPTEAEQRAVSNFLADHIVGLSCTIDGTPVANLSSFRFESPQFTFTAPSPWIFGGTGGTGTAVADGYYIFLKPLSAGQHVLHYTGGFHFAVDEGDPFDFDAEFDMTYNLNVVPNASTG